MKSIVSFTAAAFLGVAALAVPIVPPPPPIDPNVVRLFGAQGAKVSFVTETKTRTISDMNVGENGELHFTTTEKTYQVQRPVIEHIQLPAEVQIKMADFGGGQFGEWTNDVTVGNTNVRLSAKAFRSPASNRVGILQLSIYKAAEVEPPVPGANSVDGWELLNSKLMPLNHIGPTELPETSDCPPGGPCPCPPGGCPGGKHPHPHPHHHDKMVMAKVSDDPKAIVAWGWNGKPWEEGPYAAE